MKTTYLTSLTTSFDPFTGAAKVPRLLLTFLSADAFKAINVKITQLPRNSPQPATLELGFKDGKSLKYSWLDKSKMPKLEKGQKREKPITLGDIVGEINRHARLTQRKEELAG